MEHPQTSFRKLSLSERRIFINAHWTLPYPPVATEPDLDLADRLIENAVGWFHVPLGIVVGLPVDGELYDVPLAVEEPSVIAGASYASKLLAQANLTTWVNPAVMTAQVWLSFEPVAADQVVQRFEACQLELEQQARAVLQSMEQRGGGLRDLAFRSLKDNPLIGVVEFFVDVRDALGANLLNTLAEGLSGFLEKTLNGKKVLAILSNDGSKRLAGAEFCLDTSVLDRGDRSGVEVAQRIVLAAQIAEADPTRAVTNNKGIMNGVSSLALATGNDTRALEASVHAWAARSGLYTSLSHYEFDGHFLKGQIEMPSMLATVGGSVSQHPGVQNNLAILRNPDAAQLSRIACALGLAQNFAALLALTGDGIQKGHMSLHRRRLQNPSTEQESR